MRTISENALPLSGSSIGFGTRIAVQSTPKRLKDDQIRAIVKPGQIIALKVKEKPDSVDVPYENGFFPPAYALLLKNRLHVLAQQENLTLSPDWPTG